MKSFIKTLQRFAMRRTPNRKRGYGAERTPKRINEDGMDKIPDGARLICAYTEEIVCTVWDDEYTIIAFLHENNDKYELWILGSWSRLISSKDKEKAIFGTKDSCEVYRVTSISKTEDQLSACLDLLKPYIRNKKGFHWPNTFLVGGIVNEKSFKDLVTAIESDIHRITEETKKRETSIVKTARELGLHPYPLGTEMDIWTARCPGTNHRIHINAKSEVFGCGYCRVNGGSKELRAFVQERKSRK
ncbi:MAG: hypothetical protein ACE5D7_08705 [Fidelibacterota bacterium]